MENKYFIPDIEELHIGYECEYYVHDFLNGFIWEVNTIDVDTMARICKTYKRFRTMIRVPYLTKEQIEAEGWWMNGDNVFVKEDHVVIIYPTQNKIEIRHLGHPSYTISSFYLGECKDINTFRKICKLLKIN